jgi:hypothetical protein
MINYRTMRNTQMVVGLVVNIGGLAAMLSQVVDSKLF